MSQQFLCERSPFHVLHQTLGYEIAQFNRICVGFGKAWRWIARYLKQCAHRMNIRHGWIAFGQLDGRNTNRPNVTSRIVRLIELLFTGDHFRCHPVRCAHAGVSPGHRCCQMWAHAKVDQFHVTLFRQQNIMTFDVSMHAMVFVQINQRLNGLTQNVRDLMLC